MTMSAGRWCALAFTVVDCKARAWSDCGVR